MGPSQKNTLSRVSVLQPKALHFHYFILKVPCFLQFFGQPRITTIILWVQFHHLFYQVRLNKTVFLIFQLTFVQDSQMLLLSQLHTIVTWFLDMTWCVHLLQKLQHTIIQQRSYFIKHYSKWFVFKLQGLFNLFFIPLTDIRRLKVYAHLKSIFNGISSSHSLVTWEIIWVKNQFVNGYVITNGQCIFPIGIHTIFVSSNK